MKLRKVFASVMATAVAVASLATVASADVYVDPNVQDIVKVNSTSWLIVPFHSDEKGALPEAEGGEGKPLVDFGIDCTQIKKVRFTVKPNEDTEAFDKTLDTFGGNIVLSANKGKGKSGSMSDEDSNAANWQQFEWWGIYNGEDTAGYDAEKPVTFEDNGDGTYTAVADFSDSIGVPAGYALVQLAISEWAASSWAPLEVVSCEALDASDNVLLGFDGLGNCTTGQTNKYAAGGAVEDTTTDVSGDTAAGDTSADTGAADKGNADTGIEGVAAVAGLALVAAGAVIVSKKRK